MMRKIALMRLRNKNANAGCWDTGRHSSPIPQPLPSREGELESGGITRTGCINQSRYSPSLEGRGWGIGDECRREQQPRSPLTHLNRFLITLTLFLLTIAGWAAETWQLTILHTNDLHGMMQPYNYPGQLLNVLPRKDTGGLARRATLVAQLRKEAKNPVVVIDGGDLFTRGPWHTKFYGEPEIEALNLIGYDMFCVGNNEFKAKAGVESQPILLGLMRRSRFPWLAANLTVGDTGVPVEGMHPYIVRTYGTVRVGFLGLTAPRSAEYAQVKGWAISDPIAAAKKWVPLARQECDILIAVTHIGVDLDKQLAAAVPGIDAIIGGDSHTYIRKPIMIKNPAGVQVPIVQAGEQGVAVGELDLTFEHTDAWRLTAADGKLIFLDKSYPEDPAVKALLDRYLTPAKVGLLPELVPLPWAA
ncbi:MAG: bifunctional metallophosphatase/5'-nucleotidase [Armatimonadota bacterium]